MWTPLASIKTFWVYALHIVLGMCLVDYPWYTQAHRSHWCAEWSAIATWIPGPCHRSCQSTSGISRGRGLARASPSKFLQVMLDLLLSSSFYALPGAFLRDPPFSHWLHDDVTPLPANALPPLGEPTYHSGSCQAVYLCMHYKSGWITASFISPPASEGKTSPVHWVVAHQTLRTTFHTS